MSVRFCNQIYYKQLQGNALLVSYKPLAMIYACADVEKRYLRNKERILCARNYRAGYQEKLSFIIISAHRRHTSGTSCCPGLPVLHPVLQRSRL